MRQLLSIAVAGSLGGCSLIYNPSNLPAAPIDAGVMIDAEMIDAEIILDVNPQALSLMKVTPTTLDEGVGVDGSRPTVLVIEGMQIVPGATVTLTRTGGGATTAMPDNTMVAIAGDADVIAVPVTVGIDTNLGPSKATKTYTLDVTVTNPGVPPQTLPAAVTVTGYDELDATSAPTGKVASGVHQYSQVNLPSLAASDVTNPLSIRSNSSITITGAVTASGTGVTPGPGGGAGGAAGSTLGAGGDGTGMGKGIHNGGGGGFATAGGAGNGTGGAGNLGDVGLHSLMSNRGSGGAGASATVGAGGVGGGGGGTVELTANGFLKIGSVIVDGGSGTTTASAGAQGGGGGSGGGILLRLGGALQQVPTLSARGAAAVSSGGAGGDGRIRIDTASPTDAVTATPSAYHGPMFVADTALIVRADVPVITVTCETNMPFSYYIIDPDGNTHTGPAQTCGTMRKEDIDLGVGFTPLKHGINRMCVSVPGAMVEDATPEDRNCIEIVDVLKP